MKTKILLLVLSLLVVVQFFTIDKNTPSVAITKDFLVLNQTEKNMASMLTNACYDCHSYQTSYPWYANVAPLSWWIKHHINEGREHLNFSEWGNYSDKKLRHKLEECIELTQEEEMPLSNYISMHSEANLTDEERSSLVDYFKELLNGGNQPTMISGEEETEENE